jgi:hypothetical protein
MRIRIVVISLLAASTLFAHCDSLDGPVVEAARRAIASADVNLVLPWVPPADEAAIRQAFERTISVRALNPSARELADTWFFETVVRIHRAGEGAPYEGLKPAGAERPAAIHAADKALASGNLHSLEKTLTESVQHGLREHFARALAARSYKTSDVEAGRRYVAAYVELIHFAEKLEKTLAAASEHAAAHVH